MKRLFFSIALALVIHGLIFCFNGKWLKNKPYHQVRPASVTISLTSLPSAVTSSDSQPLHSLEKKAGDISENQFRNTERVPERPAGKPELPGDSIQKDIPPASGVTESNAFTGLLPSPIADKGYTGGDPKNGSDGLKQAYGRSAGEMSPIFKIIKEAVPLYTENPAPVYPMQAKKRGYEGTVILEVLVTKEGMAGKVSVFQSSRHPILDEAAVSSVKKWRFEPGKRGDEKVDMPVKIPIRFQLEED
ncbi:MAG: energy transducer TonB [Desulfobacterales bacterium]|nr:energy transducer TonB [Desulfobacterales bacterium]